jgi:signal-transduction protein with cAMP-binding, CBS, and nucleotidyltransferase domain
MDEEKILGIFTERDYMNKIILQGFSSKETRIKNTMTVRVVCIRADNTVEEGLAIMTQKRCRHLPVCQDGKLIGLVSMGDLVNQIIKDQKATIDYLKDFITINY